jgi:ribosomal protein L11 methyltransferase
LNWLEISVQVDDEETTKAICELFDHYGEGGAVQEQILLGKDEARSHIPPPVTVKTYLPLKGVDDERRYALEKGLSFLAKLYPLSAPQFRELQEEDWANAWKAHFQPQRIGQHLVFKLAEQDFSPVEDDIVMNLEPGMAFGTGLHPTTRMCLVCLEHYLRVGDRVLDMGTGSGILAIAAARLGAGGVLALDNDPVAVRAARRNVSLNSLANVIEVQEGSLAYLTETSSPLLDGIAVNILAEVIANMMEKGLTSHLKSGAWLIAGGIVEAAETMLRAMFEKCGMQINARHQEKDWVTLCGVKLRPATGLQSRREEV